VEILLLVSRAVKKKACKSELYWQIKQMQNSFKIKKYEWQKEGIKL